MSDKLKQILTTRHIVSAVAIAFILYGSYSTIQVIGYNYKLQQDIDKLNSEVELLELQNKQLEYSIAYYKTDAFADREARDKLGLQAPGEQVVIFPDRIPRELETPKTPEQIAEEQNFSQRSKSNLEQWMFFLFRKEPN